MGHYAKVLDGKVISVIVAEEDHFVGFIDSTPGEWVKTSYNTHGGIHYKAGTSAERIPEEDQAASMEGHPERSRKNYAVIGGNYDRNADAFYPPKVFDSWVLNQDTFLWEAPVAKPADDGIVYMWNEATVSWIPNPWQPPSE